jgi:hypothetical protein
LFTFLQASPVTNPSRSSTPGPTSEMTTESTAADETLLRQFATALVDIRAMTSQVLKLWREEISDLLPDTSTEDNMEEAVLEG